VIGWLVSCWDFPPNAWSARLRAARWRTLWVAVARMHAPGSDVREGGLPPDRDYTVYASTETHSSVGKASRAAGAVHERASLRCPVIRRYTIDVKALRATLARQGKGLDHLHRRQRGNGEYGSDRRSPCPGCTEPRGKTSGSTSHGAFGALRALVPELRPLVAGLSRPIRSHSICTNGSTCRTKWGARSCAIRKRIAPLQRDTAYLASFDRWHRRGRFPFAERGIQLSRARFGP